MTGDSGGGLILSEAEAKAVQEVAKTGGKVIEAVGGVGRYLAAVFGQLPHDAVGILGDRVKYVRARLAMEAERKLKERGVAHPDPPSSSVLVPLLAAAEDEDRPEITDLWAGLLATAMDPATRGRVRRSFFPIVQKLEPVDAQVLRAIYPHSYRVPNISPERTEEHAMSYSHLKAQIIYGHTTKGQLDASIHDLRNMNLLETPREYVALTPFGAGLVEACEPI